MSAKLFNHLVGARDEGRRCALPSLDQKVAPAHGNEVALSSDPRN
jgi:hypothetical protein